MLVKEEEAGGHSHMYSEMLYDLWSTSRLWYNLALLCPEGLLAIYTRQLKRKYEATGKTTGKTVENPSDKQ